MIEGHGEGAFWKGNSEGKFWMKQGASQCKRLKDTFWQRGQQVQRPRDRWRKQKARTSNRVGRGIDLEEAHCIEPSGPQLRFCEILWRLDLSQVLGETVWLVTAVSKDNHNHRLQFGKAASSVDRNRRSQFSWQGATPSLDTCSHSFLSFFFFFFDTYLFLAVLSLHCCAWAFSGCNGWGLLSHCSSRPPRCSDFSCCRAWVLGQEFQ